ncbi:helix-turn-helix domain-containing protein [Acetobacter nitrogenifigens]|uniref:YdaS family helix-turn-helix protein n=1 Tax=Acetobacter nitrogenifigens TaxID=285268 RepID=UPI0013789240|nr:YdaS family helix-turn-helix protein [Acetobacter nitrogenifigens]
MLEIRRRAGGCKKLAQALGYKNHSSVVKWREVPSRHIVQIEKKFNIPRELIRPDLFDGLCISRAKYPVEGKERE